jgi:inner membrane protein
METPNASAHSSQAEKQEEMSDFKKFMRSYTARIIVSVLIIVVMLIPTQQVAWLIKERKSRQDQVTKELKEEWGPELEFFGVVLEIPAVGKKKDLLYVYPERSEEVISTNVNERYRGIFKANLFTADIKSMNHFNLDKIRSNPEHANLDWKRARILLLTGEDVRFNALSKFMVNGKEVSISGQINDYRLTSYSNRFDIPLTENELKISYDASANGTESLVYQPISSQSSLELKSNWKDPSFSGALPENGSFKNVPTGITAKWKSLSHIGNGSRTTANFVDTHGKARSEIKFMTMLDQYQLNDRTIKYCILVLTLTFAVFFLVQIVGKTYVHPLHYLMIGLALLLFYSLLLSLSEHLGFNGAYLVSAAAIILLVVWYAKAILNSLKFAIVCGLSLSLLYGFLLVLVNLEIYALLVGSIGLLAVLAAIMSVTRKLNFDNL